MTRKIKIDFDVNFDAVRRAKSEFEALNDTVGETKGSFDDIKTAARALGFDNVTGEVENVVQKFKDFSGAARNLTGLSAGAALALSGLVAAITGVGLAVDRLTERFKEMDAQVKAIQKSFGVTREEAMRLNATIIALAKSGLALEGSFTKLNQISKNLGISMSATLNLMAKFNDNLSPEDAEEAIDFLGEYAQYFQKLGYSAQEAASIIANSFKEGGFTDKIPDAIKEFSIRINDLSDSQKEMAANAGLSDILNDVSKGAISGATAIGMVVNRLNELKASGKDVTPIITALFGAPGEDAEKTLLLLSQIKDESLKINEVAERKRQLDAAIEESNQRTLERMKVSSALWDWVVSQGKTLWLHMEGIVGAITDFANIVSGAVAIGVGGLLEGFIEILRVCNGIGEVISGWFSLDFTDIAGKFKKGYEEIDKLEAERKEKRKKEEEEELRKRASGVLKKVENKPASAAGVVASESALAEAEARLKKHIINVRNATELALKNKVKTQEEANLDLLKQEQAHYENVVSLAIKLQGQRAVVDGKVVEYAKLTTKELREIEEKREEFKHKIRVAEIEKQIAHNKHLLEIYLIGEQEKNEILEDSLNKRQNILDMQFDREEISFLEHLKKTHELQLEAIDDQIKDLKASYEKKKELLKHNHEELEVLEAEYSKMLAELNKERMDKMLAYQRERAKFFNQIAKETSKTLEDLSDRINNITAQNNPFFDNLVKYTNDLYAFNKELAHLSQKQEKLTKLLNEVEPKSREEAILKEALEANSAYIAQVLKEKMASKIITVLEAIRQVADAIFKTISESMQREIEILDRALEKRREIYQVSLQQYTAEEARLKTIMEIESLRQETRNRELEDLSKNIPEAQQGALEKERETERQRAEMRKAQVELNIENEKRRLREIEGAQKVIENRKLRLQEKQFEVERAGKITETIINSLVAQVKLWANPGFPAAIPLAAVLLGTTIASVSQIASQKNPYTQRFAKGTLNVKGGIEGKDSVPALLMPGEAVIPTDINNEYRETISAIFNKKIPASVLNSIVRNNAYNRMDTVLATIDAKPIVDAIKQKPVSIVKIDEEGFKEFIVNTHEEYLITKKKLGL
jgi:hypothetical protein